MNSATITVSASGKLMLLGEHAVVYHHPCLVTAIDQRFHLSLERLNEPVFELNAVDIGLESYKKNLGKAGGIGKNRRENRSQKTDI